MISRELDNINHMFRFHFPIDLGETWKFFGAALGWSRNIKTFFSKSFYFIKRSAERKSSEWHELAPPAQRIFPIALSKEKF